MTSTSQLYTATTPASTEVRPTLRPRRMRISANLRRMVQETVLTPADFIYPLFVRPGQGIRKPIGSMPGQFQLSVDQLAQEAEEIAGLGIPGVILFGIPAEKDACGSENFNPEEIGRAHV